MNFKNDEGHILSLLGENYCQTGPINLYSSIVCSLLPKDRTFLGTFHCKFKNVHRSFNSLIYVNSMHANSKFLLIKYIRFKKA